MTGPALGTRHWLAWVTLLVTGAVLIFWALPRIEIVRGEDAQVDWLRRHATTQTYTVTELGLGRSDGTVVSVFVADPGYPDAFVDLRHSDQRVRVEGETVEARVDHRIPNSTGTGVAADAVDHRFVVEYLQAGWPGLLGLGLWGLGAVFVRKWLG